MNEGSIMAIFLIYCVITLIIMFDLVDRDRNHKEKIYLKKRGSQYTLSDLFCILMMLPFSMLIFIGSIKLIGTKGTK